MDYTTRIVGFPLRKGEYGRAKWNLIHITQEILVPFGNHHKKTEIKKTKKIEIKLYLIMISRYKVKILISYLIMVNKTK